MKISVALSGGAVHGAFEVGVLQYLLQRGFDIVHISGTSIGAINGAMVAQGDFDKLLEIWMNTTDHKRFFKHWFPFSYLQGYFKGSLYNSQPLRDTLNEVIDPGRLCRSKTLFTACSVNLSRDEKFYYDNDRGNEAAMNGFIYASAAFPIAFEPFRFGGDVFWDGGLKEPIPAKVLTERDTDPDAYIVVLTSPLQEPREDLGKTLVPLGLRAVTTMFSEIYQNDVDKGQKFWKNPKFHIVAPKRKYLKDSFDFDHLRISEAIFGGYTTAQEVLAPLC